MTWPDLNDGLRDIYPCLLVVKNQLPVPPRGE